jgi:hypothetical protein
MPLKLRTKTVRYKFIPIKAMFVFQKIVFRESLSKLSRICLPLEKLVNEKYFPVNEKHFPVKEKLSLVSRKVFSLLAMFVFRKVVSGKSLSKLSCVCLPLEKLVNGKHFLVKEKFNLVFRKVFPGKFGRKTLSRSCEKFRNIIIC